jgi:hypothetical protein
MTTQPQNPNPNQLRSIELLEHLVEASETQTAIISDLVNDIHAMLDTFALIAQALSHPPAPAPAAAQPTMSAGGTYQDFGADTLIMTTNDKGEPAYKLMGFPFSVFGVRTWPETLPSLGIDPAQLKPGPNPISLQVRALMVESSTKPGTLTPKKIIGLAP